MKIACEFCSEYLKKQIDILEPYVIVCFGDFVNKKFRKLLNDDKLFVGKLLESPHPTKKTYWYFPSQSNANRWIEEEYSDFKDENPTMTIVDVLDKKIHPKN